MKLGIGFALGGRLNIEWEPKISCNLRGCALSGPMVFSLDGTVRFLLLSFETEYSISHELGGIERYSVFFPFASPLLPSR